jgi:hypothetical protein
MKPNIALHCKQGHTNLRHTAKHVSFYCFIELKYLVIELAK